MAYDLGDPVPLSVEVLDSSDALANAGAVTVTVTQPDGTDATPPSVLNPSTGVYTATFIPTQEGRHTVRWVATGLNASAYTDAFDVNAATTPAIVSLADAKRHLNIPTSNTDNDEELRDVIDAASEWVESRVGVVVRRTITEYHAPTYSRNLVLYNSPVISLTSVTSTDGWSYTYDVAGLYPDLGSGIIRLGLSSNTWTYPINVTYVAGRAVVPAAIRLACLMYLKSLWETQRGASGVALQGFEEEGVSDAGGLLVYKAEQLLEPYRLPPAVA